ncbi:hypothetical protein OCS_01746 [Ophiocordyceps sinensis CO18]|uniref:Uncharacterized protein n=1 Tax=Ophiocordyceps sinensis (strain Co18 / CGMCC 3.14243) TaxID=911162 RepID=T5AIV5_OPHSC|nr:hypothetical protein OCS_01746 [Ophiocordyceps sinensis CO18]
MTLGSRQWWEQHGQWLEANKKALKLKAKDWNRRDEALSGPDDVEEDGGKHDWDFVCVAAPTAGDEDDEEENDEQDKDEQDTDEGKRGPVGKLASLHPSHIWCFSVKGNTRGQWWILETLKRDPDEFCMHIYNDFAIYGAMEVVENLLGHFAKVCKPSADYRDIWCEVEGLALLLRSGVANFNTCDDPDTLGQLVELIGHMCLGALRAIKKQGALNTTGPIPNFGLVLSIIIKCCWELGECTGDREEHTAWVYAVMEMAEEAGIKVTGMPGYESTLEKLELDEDDNYTAAAKKKWGKSNFQTQASHSRRVRPGLPAGIGGSHFDITKMTAAQRKSHSYGG